MVIAKLLMIVAAALAAGALIAMAFDVDVAVLAAAFVLGVAALVVDLDPPAPGGPA